MKTTTCSFLARALLSTTTLAVCLLSASCYVGSDAADENGEEDHQQLPTRRECAPLMSVHPVAEAHNTGYDPSCATGNCEVSCPDLRANSDWGGGDRNHHGNDIFARRGAPLVAVADGVIEAVGVVSDTSGLRVRLRDACGWEYYYGHLEEAYVRPGDVVIAGQPVGTMGASGAASVHLHFNVSYNGDYENDIDPIDILQKTSPTACSGVGSTLPRVIFHNSQTSARFTLGEETCTFDFMHGNYGVGYATILATGGACSLVRSTVVSATETAFYTATNQTSEIGVGAQATAEAGLILSAEYCVQMSSGQALSFTYNALANAIDEEVVLAHGCS